MNSRLFAFAAVFALAAASPALAGDGWTGFYAGGALSQNSVTADVTDYMFQNESSSGPKAEDNNVALLAGYRRDFDRLVLGAELEWSVGKTDLEDSNPCSENSAMCAAAGMQGSLDNQRRLRGLAGYHFDDNTLLFVSGGVSMADATISGVWGSVSDGIFYGEIHAPTDLPTETLYGFNVGAGAEARLTNRLSLRAEVIYDQYEDYDLDGREYVVVASSYDQTSILHLSDSVGFSNLSTRLALTYGF